MYAVRLWSIRHAGFWEAFYRRFERVFVAAGPLLRRIGFDRLEAPAAALEREIKGLLFDCQMCGSCVLSSTGMSCPMNCPKQMRNGPCGGVRADGHCEVKPAMRCVWVQAWKARAGWSKATGSPSCSRRSTIAAAAARPGCVSCASGSDDRFERPALRRPCRPAAAAARPQLARPARARPARGAVCGHLGAQPARFGRPARRLRPGRGPVGGLRRYQRGRCLGRPRPHVERRHLRS